MRVQDAYGRHYEVPDSVLVVLANYMVPEGAKQVLVEDGPLTFDNPHLAEAARARLPEPRQFIFTRADLKEMPIDLLAYTSSGYFCIEKAPEDCLLTPEIRVFSRPDDGDPIYLVAGWEYKTKGSKARFQLKRVNLADGRLGEVEETYFYLYLDPSFAAHRYLSIKRDSIRAVTFDQSGEPFFKPI